MTDLLKLEETKSLPKLYKITNLITNKIYIGSTRQPLVERWKNHCSKHSKCERLKNSILKHGKENFKIELLCVGSEEYISDLEVKAILYYNCLNKDRGYNLKLRGKKPNSVGETTKQRISSSLKNYYENNPSKTKGKPSPARKEIEVDGVVYSTVKGACKSIGINYKTLVLIRKAGLLHNTPDYFRKTKEEKYRKSSLKIKQYYERNTHHRKGTVLSEDHKNSISKANKGKVFSDNHRKRLSESKTGANNPNYGKHSNGRTRPVVVDGVEYPSITEAVRQTKYTKSSLEKSLKKGINNVKYK